MERHSHGGHGMVVRSTSPLDFLRRIFARLASYFTRVRRLFYFKMAKDGSREVKEGDVERGALEIKVEGGGVEASRAREPDLAEIIVTETTCDVEICEGCSTMDMEDSAPPACTIECASEPSTSDPCQQEPQKSVACESGSGMLPELFHGEDCTVTSEQETRHSQAAVDEGEKRLQNGSQDEELVEDSLIQGSSIRAACLPSLKRKPSIKELNAVVAQQLTKCLQALERSMVPSKAEHRRAIILATLVAIAVWARNAKHLFQSLPRLTRGSHINVRFRSRL